MKIKLNKETKIIWGIFVILTSFFVISHLTPEISVRTKVLFSGHPKEAFFSEVKEADKKAVLNQDPKIEKATYYHISPAPVEKATKSNLDLYQVEEKFNLHFSSFHSNI